MRLSSPQHRLLLGMRRGLVRGKRRPTALHRHGADGSARIPAVAIQIQLLNIPALDTSPGLTHRPRIHVVVASEYEIPLGPRFSAALFLSGNYHRHPAHLGCALSICRVVLPSFLA